MQEVFSEGDHPETNHGLAPHFRWHHRFFVGSMEIFVSEVGGEGEI